MYTHKKGIAGFLAFAMTWTLAACGAPSDTGGGGAAAPADTAVPPAVAATDTANDPFTAPAQLTAWEESSQIYATDETDAELYEKAKDEGEVTIYSGSSRMQKVAESFMKKYPGVNVQVYDIAAVDMMEKVTREYEAGVHTADIAHLKDQDGVVYNEYLLPKKFYSYRPSDILAHVSPEFKAYGTPMGAELNQLFYNTEKYPDGAPLDSLWDLTRPEWKGRVIMQKLTENLTLLAWATSLCTGEVPEQLASNYEEEFGEKLVLSEGCENAGYEFLKRLLANEPIIAHSSGEVTEAIGTRGQNDPPVGFAASSQLRKAKDNGWAMDTINLKPTNGVVGVSMLYIVEGCEHPYAAKLLIRYIMGGIDGDTAGFQPFNVLGGWPVRDDIAPAEGSQPLSELNLTPGDPMLLYDNVTLVQDFCTLASAS